MKVYVLLKRNAAGSRREENVCVTLKNRFAEFNSHFADYILMATIHLRI